MFKLKNEKRNYVLNLPTNFSELDFNSIKEVIGNVKLSEHYAIVAICQSFSPFNLALLGTKNKDVNIPVSTCFISANDPNGKIANAEPGDKVILSRSDIEMSTHLPVTFGLSTSSIAATISDNPSAATILRNGPVDEEGNPVREIISVEFKIVPLTAIKAIVARRVATKDIYKSTISNN